MKKPLQQNPLENLLTINQFELVQRFKIFVFGVFILLIVNVPSSAQGMQEIYGLAGVGCSHIPLKRNAIEDNIFEGSTEDKVLGLRALIGAQVHDYIMVEIGYLNFGKVTFDGLYTWEGYPTEDTGEIKTSGFAASVVGAYPILDRISALGKLGLFVFSVKEDEVFGGIPESHSASGISPMIGLGVQARITDQFGARIDWDYILKVGKDGETGEAPASVFWAGVLYFFEL